MPGFPFGSFRVFMSTDILKSPFAPAEKESVESEDRRSDPLKVQGRDGSSLKWQLLG